MHNLSANNSTKSLLTPEQLFQALPTYPPILNVIQQHRATITHIINGADPRLLVVVGPCSIHDIVAAQEYAVCLQKAAQQFEDKLFLVMRVYFEKPRTTLGWKGLINDPWLDGSFDVNQGITLARKLLLNLAAMNMPVGTEFLDTLVAPYVSDLISWGAIGARTVESQMHRELASGLPLPIGFKNNTDGNMKVAVDAVNVARHAHSFLTISQSGTPIVTRTTGNAACHIILRGANNGINYTMRHIDEAVTLLQNAHLTPRLMIDCSHGNSMKNHEQQCIVARYLAEKIRAGCDSLCGVMLESHLVAGKQDFLPGKPLVYGQSITDSCLSWTDTARLLEELAEAQRL